VSKEDENLSVKKSEDKPDENSYLLQSIPYKSTISLYNDDNIISFDVQNYSV